MAITKITKTELLELTSTTGAVRLPSGTTAERPSTNLNAGDFRFNTDDNKVEYYDGSSWFQIDDESEPPVPSENFNTVLWAGNDATQAITGVGFQADFVWIKRRNSAEPYALYDSVRGINKQLETNSQNAQATNTAPNEGFTSFDSDGFTVGNNGGTNRVPNTYVGWCIKGGGAPTATNSASSGAMDANSVSLDGTLQSAYTPSGSPNIYPNKMSINTKAGFSIVSFTSNGVAGVYTTSHGLLAEPELVIFKNMDNSSYWFTYLNSIGDNGYLQLQDSTGTSSFTPFFDVTASTIGLRQSSVGVNGEEIIAYSFHSVDGYQKIGTYTGNGSAANGPVVVTGFEPAFLLIKKSSGGDNWVLYDNKRDLYNSRYKYLSPNNTDAEGSDDASNYPIINFLTNGFQIAGTDGRVNTNSGTYIYLAIAADADTTTPTLANSFKTNLYTGNGSTQTIGGHLSGAAQFNGSNSLIDISGFSNFASTGVSISAWINVSSFSSGPTILNLYSNNSIVFGTNSSGQFFRSGQGTTVTSAATMSTGTWHHVVMTANTSADTILYLDGFIAGSGNSTTAMYNSNSNKDLIGAYGTNSQPMDGSIDQVRVYNSVLTASQVSELYNETSSTANTLDFPAGAGCIAAYPLNSNSNDLSGNYNGTDSNITYSEGPGFKPTFVWAKARNSGYGQPTLFDSVRGPGNFLESSAPTAAFEFADYGVQSFDNDSYTVSDIGNGGYRVNGASGGLYSGTPPNYVGWTWKGAGNLPTINTDGSITSIVSANPASGFSTVKYTGNGGSSQSVGHGLNSAPEYVILKRYDTSVNWFVFILINGTYERFEGLNTTSASTSVSYFGATSDTITWSGTTSDFNGNGNLYLMYCFHSVTNFCHIGSYTGNRPTDVQVPVPFQPTWVMIKDSDTGGEGWTMIDSSRGNQLLQADSNAAEVAYTGVTFTATGFTVGDSGLVNTNGATITYLAFKE